MKLVRKILVAMLLGTMAIQVVWADINEDFLNAASAYQCDLDKVKQLLRLGADVNVDNGRAFINAHSCSKAIEIMEYLISQGLDINAKGVNDSKTVVDRALEVVDKGRDYNLVKYLISKGANANFNVYKTSNRLLDSIMSYPTFIKGELDIIEYVISKGAFVGIDDLRRFLFNFHMDSVKK